MASDAPLVDNVRFKSTGTSTTPGVSFVDGNKSVIFDLSGITTSTPIKLKASGSSDITLGGGGGGGGSVTANNVTAATGSNSASFTGNGPITLSSTGSGSIGTVTVQSAGSTANAIKIDATAGGVNVDAKTGFPVDISGGSVVLKSKEDKAGAIELTANVGVSETITVTNTKGTTAGAIAINATAGGVDVDAAPEKEVNISGGKVVIISKDGTTGAIALTANAGSGETITVTNTQGIADKAIDIVSSVGGVHVESQKQNTTGALKLKSASGLKIESVAGTVANSADLQIFATGTGSTVHTVIDIDNKVKAGTDTKNSALTLRASGNNNFKTRLGEHVYLVKVDLTTNATTSKNFDFKFGTVSSSMLISFNITCDNTTTPADSAGVVGTGYFGRIDSSLSSGNITATEGTATSIGGGTTQGNFSFAKSGNQTLRLTLAPTDTNARAWSGEIKIVTRDELMEFTHPT